MILPVLLSDDPRDAAWAVGERVSTRLRWLDTPGLPDDLIARGVAVRASALIGFDGQPWAQLVEAGGLRAVRDGHLTAGELTLDGCLGYDVLLPLVDELPDTAGIVRRVRLLQELHDRGADEWVVRPGAYRLIDVPDASAWRLRDDPSLDADPGDAEPDPETMVIMSPEEYFRAACEWLPREQWQARGFLVDLEVTDRGR